MSIRMNSPLFYPCLLCLEFVVCVLSVVVILPGPVVCLSLTKDCVLCLLNRTQINDMGKKWEILFNRNLQQNFIGKCFFDWLRIALKTTQILAIKNILLSALMGYFLKLVLTHWLVSADKYTHIYIHMHTLLWVRGMEVHNLGSKLCTSLGCKSWLCGKGKAWWGWLHCSHKGRSEWSRLST